MSESLGLIRNNANNVQLINRGEEDEATCFGYRTNKLKLFVYYICVLISFGTILLLFYWKPNWRVYFICNKSIIKDSDCFLLKDANGQLFVVDVENLFVEELLKTNINDNLNSINSHFDDKTDDDDIETLEQQLIDALNSDRNNDRIKLSSYEDIVNQKKCIKFFTFQKLRYAWNREKRMYEKVCGYDRKTKTNALLNNFRGYSQQMQNIKRKFYGPNSIEVEVKSYFKLLIEEVLNPFYIFQIMACTLWMIDDYYLYASCIVIISLISIIVSLIETRRQAQTLHDMVKMNIKIDVSRSNNRFEEVSAECLVPGDIIRIKANAVMACDAVLLNGTCVLNESMLTGESVPVIKTQLPQPDNPDEYFDVETHKRHTLFSGTQVVQVRNYDSNADILAVVIRTGFNTSKGDLVRSILFPKPMGFQFYTDSIRFIGFLFIVAFIGMIYGAVILRTKGVDIGDIILRALDIITIVVPPALPAAMTVGTVYAQNRLKKQLIYCISPPRINIAGKLKLICFDKTGTLTEDGLDVWGAIEIDKDLTFKPVVEDLSQLENSDLLKALATCHSLTRLEGKITGDPLDVKMFESTKWSFIDDSNGAYKFEQTAPYVKQNKNDQNDLEIAIVKQFTFSSALLRMSVLCKTHGTDYMEVFTKGAPEKISTLCKPETLPENFNQILHKYTVSGFRVIALAGKRLNPNVSWLQASKLQREAIESDLTFYGLLVMQNMIKPVTPEIIKELMDAQITAVMVTGDNLHTAIHVGRNCGLIPQENRVIIIEAYGPSSDNPVGVSDGNEVPARIEWVLAETVDDLEANIHGVNDSQHQVINLENSNIGYNFAISGKSFAVLRRYFPKLFEKILVNGTIYARMSPDQKAQLVEHLMSIGYVVAMCGDGANDCGALKAAHVGISLSEAEASVASPFTSKKQDISCVPTLIKEGRAALVTSFGVFKYMALYSVTQFISVLILYSILSNLTDPQFLYIDLFLITPVAVFMSATSAYEKLSVKRPLGSLVGFVNISSILYQILLVILFQLFGFFYLKQQSWYVPLVPSKDDFKNNGASMETTVVFLVSIFQYVVLAFVFSKGPPYRKSIMSNFPFIASLLILLACNVWLTLGPVTFIESLLKMKRLDPDKSISFFRFSLVGLAFIYSIVSYCVEDLIVEKSWYKAFGRKCLRKKQFKNKYKRIKTDVNGDKSWPYIGRITFNESYTDSNVINSSDYKY